MANLKFFFSACLVVVTLCVVACSQKHEQLSGALFHAQSKSSVLKQNTQKPGAAVSLIAPQIIQINANQLTAVELHLRVLQQGKLRIKISGSEGVQLLSTAEIQTLEINTKEITLPVQLNAPFNGRFYLHLDATLETPEAISSRSLAVAVQVGGVSTKALKPSVQSSLDKGEAVVSLPAQETIKP